MNSELNSSEYWNNDVPYLPKKAIEETMQKLGLSERNILRWWNTYWKTGEIFDANQLLKKKRAKAARVVRKVPVSYYPAIECALDELIKAEGRSLKLETMRRKICEVSGISLSRKHCSFFLNTLGYKYSKIDKVVATGDRERDGALRAYLQAYSLALEKEEQGEAIIVYMDESYCHENHSAALAWQRKDGATPKFPASKGKRLIIVHLLWKSEKKASAELIYPAGTKGTPEKGCPTRGDYHLNMDGEMFESWVKQRLIPAFEKKYPSKKMVLVLDNASYHHSGRQFFEKTATKINMYSSMDKFNIEEINVPRLGTIRQIAQSDGGEKKTLWL